MPESTLSGRGGALWILNPWQVLLYIGPLTGRSELSCRLTLLYKGEGRGHDYCALQDGIESENPNVFKVCVCKSFKCTNVVGRD